MNILGMEQIQYECRANLVEKYKEIFDKEITLDNLRIEIFNREVNVV